MDRFPADLSYCLRLLVCSCGYVPLGYDVQDGKLVIKEAEAASVRRIFEQFVELGSAFTICAFWPGRHGRSRLSGRFADGTQPQRKMIVVEE